MRRFLVCAVVAAIAGCGDAGVSPQELTIALQANPLVAAVGDSVSFVATARGTGLFGVEMVYGDGTSEAYNTAGARDAQITFRHAFAAAGTYQVQATATDSRAGSRTASVSVTIQ